MPVEGTLLGEDLGAVVLGALARRVARLLVGAGGGGEARAGEGGAQLAEVDHRGHGAGQPGELELVLGGGVADWAGPGGGPLVGEVQRRLAVLLLLLHLVRDVVRLDAVRALALRAPRPQPAPLVQAAEGEEGGVEFVEVLGRQPGPHEGQGEAWQPRPELEVVVEEGRVGVAEAGAGEGEVWQVLALPAVPRPGVLEPDLDHLEGVPDLARDVVKLLPLGPWVHLVVGLEHEALLLGDEGPHPHLPVVLRRAALPVLAGDALVALVVVRVPLLLEAGRGAGHRLAHLLAEHLLGGGLVDALDHVPDQLEVLRVAEAVLDAVRHVEPVLGLLLLARLLLDGLLHPGWGGGRLLGLLGGLHHLHLAQLVLGLLLLGGGAQPHLLPQRQQPLQILVRLGQQRGGGGGGQLLVAGEQLVVLRLQQQLGQQLWAHRRAEGAERLQGRGQGEGGRGLGVGVSWRLLGPARAPGGRGGPLHPLGPRAGELRLGVPQVVLPGPAPAPPPAYQALLTGGV